MINFRKRLRPHKTKSVKDKSSDDDEVEWVQAAVAVAGLGLSLWEKHEQGKADKQLKKSLQAKQSQVGSAMGGVVDTLDASLGLFKDRKDEDKKIMGDNLTTKLKNDLDQVRDKGSSFANTGTDNTMVANIDNNLWSGYNQGTLKLDRQEENAKLGAYSTAYKSNADLRTQMNELESQIESLS